MNIKKIAVLVVVLILLAVVFFVVESANNNKGMSSQQQAFPDVADKVARVLLEEGGQSIELRVQDGRWVVPARGNYIADAGKVNALILRVTGLSLFHLITDRAERHDLLGVGVDVKQSGKVKISLFSNDNVPLGALFIGKAPETTARMKMSGESAFYVRKDGDNAVYSVGETLAIQIKPEYWLLSQLANIDQNAVRKIEQISISAENRVKDFQIERNSDIGEEELFRLVGSETGKQGNGEVVGLVASGLVNLRFDDVIKSDAKTDGSFNFDKETRITLANGIVYKIASAYKDGSHYIKISTSLDQSLLTEAKQEEANPTSVQSSSSSSFSGIDEINALNAQFSGWIFKVPEYVGTKFRKTLSDVTEIKDKQN